MGILGRDSTKRKRKPMKMGRSSLRLCGWMKYRISRSSKPWVHVRLDSFCDMTGLSLRTAKRALETLREANTDLVIRTIHQDRRWKIVASTCERLHTLKHSEPFSVSRTGTIQVVKKRKSGERITHEQLIVGKDKVYWNALPINGDDSSAKDDEIRTENENPKQLKMDFSVSVKNKPLVTNREFYEFKEKRKRRDMSRNYAKKQRGLAFALAREMRRCHYDNVKPRHEMRHAFVFALESIKLGVKRRTIVKAYELGMLEAHSAAVDLGVTEAGSWSPSSTIAKARRILREGGCYGRWKSSVFSLQET